MGITKHNWLITDGADIPRVVAEAFHVATTGRPGPVLIDVPKDVAATPMEWYWPEPSDLDLPGYHPMTDGDPAAGAAGGRAAPGRRAAGHLRRRRDPQGPGRRRPAGAGRADRASRW